VSEIEGREAWQILCEVLQSGSGQVTSMTVSTIASGVRSVVVIRRVGVRNS
jgi:hypothetical protein